MPVPLPIPSQLGVDLRRVYPKPSHIGVDLRDPALTGVGLRGFVFSDHPISRSPDHPILAALCLCPSARTPPPIDVLLITKAKVPFDRAVTERSKRFLAFFQRSNLAQFQPIFLVSTVRPAEGRKPFQLPCSIRPLASGQQLGAKSFGCQRSRPRAHIYL